MESCLLPSLSTKTNKKFGARKYGKRIYFLVMLRCLNGTKQFPQKRTGTE